MTITYTDSLGLVTDTDEGTQATVRANTEVEVHNAGEIDTGSKLTITQLVASHVPHRPAATTR